MSWPRSCITGYYMLVIDLRLLFISKQYAEQLNVAYYGNLSADYN